MREPFAGTAFANMDHNPDRERPVDRVAATGWANSLGLLLWRAKYQLETDAYLHAKRALVAYYCEHRSRFEQVVIVEKIADQCLHEYLSPHCTACRGAKELVTESLRITCSTCGGTGIRRYSDTARAQQMGLSVDRIKRLNRGIGWLADQINTLDAEVNRVMCEQLERTR
jgi:hypothetical protein